MHDLVKCDQVRDSCVNSCRCTSENYGLNFITGLCEFNMKLMLEMLLVSL